MRYGYEYFIGNETLSTEEKWEPVDRAVERVDRRIESDGEKFAFATPYEEYVYASFGAK